jgi:Tol biopolymer transport system component
MTMDRSTRVDRALPGLFDQLAEARTPDYLEAAIERASSRPQRPTWTFAGRWLPVELTSARVPATRMPMRQLGVLALIAILVAAALAVYVGSHQQKLPAPFGPAANGLIPFEQGGDIYVGDLATGQTRLIAGGPEHDWGASFSYDGSQLGFIRDVPPGVGGVPDADIYVVRPDGSGLRKVNAKPIRDLKYANYTPDGRMAIIQPRRPSAGCGAVTTCSVNQMEIVPTFGNEPTQRFPMEEGIIEITWRPPDGRQILYLGVKDGKYGLFVMGADGSDPHAISPLEEGTDPGLDFGNFVYSGDGNRIFFQKWTDDASDGERGCCQMYTMNADGSDYHEFIQNPGTSWDGVARVSPDGTRIAFWRDPLTGPTNGIAVIRADGTGPIIQTGPVLSGTAHFWWSPDSTKILMFPDDSTVTNAFLLDPNGGDWTTVPWKSGPDIDWQRIATN